MAGNFPYNISSQILFRVLDWRDRVPECVGMFQKEVAERVAEGPGSKTYGILSVLLQSYYDIEYLFTVHEQAFDPTAQGEEWRHSLSFGTTLHGACRTASPSLISGGW